MTAKRFRRGMMADEKILVALVQEGGTCSGSDLLRITRLWSGTFYPEIIGLEHRAMVSSKWEEATKYPRKRIYTITGHGRKHLVELELNYSETVAHSGMKPKPS